MTKSMVDEWLKKLQTQTPDNNTTRVLKELLLELEALGVFRDERPSH